ncbi:MAG: Asp-tRNA(Asn)/Glu-tRNA(Gln) amidotransferase subunit GatA [bacterium]
MQFSSVDELQKKLRNRELKSTDLVRESLATITKQEAHFKTSITVLKDQALEQAQVIDTALDKGDDLPALAGIPIGIKDNICIKNTQTTCGSRFLEPYTSPYNATVITKLQKNKGVCVSKLNLDEFAMGSSTENSAFFTTPNPWNTECVSGGSSGGSAAAVAAGQVPISLGSDTGGSIRQPAAFCGVSGLKPTYGRVSRYGLVAFASSLDQIGPFARSVKDLAYVLEAICGHDVNDATSSQAPIQEWVNSLATPPKKFKIALPKQLIGETIDEDVKHCVLQAVDTFKNQGAVIEEVDMPSLEASIATYYIIAPAEASANLARFDGVRYGRREHADTLKDMMIKSRSEGFGPEVQRRILLGTFVLSAGYYDAYYLKAQKARTYIKNDFSRIFADYDLIMSPTTPSVAFKKGEKSNPLDMYRCDLATIPANMAGLPALSIPCGFSKGLPVGLQLIAKAFDETSVLQAGHLYQQLTHFHKEIPNGV